MAKIHIDGVTHEVGDGQNLLQACLSVGANLPYFCWHPAMGSVGACRQCAVIVYRDENDQVGRVTMSCMTPATDGARLSLASPAAVEFRASVIASLMRNHPHDCPVCEEGGECHLQDMTVMSGHTVREYTGKKRTFRNQQLGPFINHEMNRCITCHRCVRFYREYAGGTDLHAFGQRDRTYFGRSEDGALESEFAGNLVEVCPTGVFTDKPFSKQYSRKWDLQAAPSVCAGCAVGCNTSPSERYGKLKRVVNRYHPDINGYFLCDRGRFGSGYVNVEHRLRSARARDANGSVVALDTKAAADQLAALVGQGGVVGIGSPRASLEANFALRTLVGVENFSSGMAATEALLVKKVIDIQRSGVARVPTLTDMEQADVVLVLGEDVLRTAPRVALSLRQSVRQQGIAAAKAAGIPQWQDAGVRGFARDMHSPFFSSTALPTQLDEIATAVVHELPAASARTGQAIAAAIASGGATASEFVAAAANALSQAKRPLIVSGTGAGSSELLDAAQSIAATLATHGVQAALFLSVPEVNSIGGCLIDGALSLEGALAALESGQARSVIVLENDLFRRIPAAQLQRALRGGGKGGGGKGGGTQGGGQGGGGQQSDAQIVVLDCVEQGLLEHADLVLPTAATAEHEGTFVNYESRAQRFYEVFRPIAEIRPAWRWLAEAGEANGKPTMAWRKVDDVIDALVVVEPALSNVVAAAPAAAFRNAVGTRIPRQPHRYSGRTAMFANVSVHEPKAPVDEGSPLSFSMEGNMATNAALLPFSWAPGWNSNQSVLHFQQDINGALYGAAAGVRLIGAIAAAEDGKTRDTTEADRPTGGKVVSATDAFAPVALYETFGSDELSALSPAIAERTPRPYVVLHSADAARLGLIADDSVLARVERQAVGLPFRLRIDDAMTRGAMGYSVGLPGSFGFLATEIWIEKDSAAASMIARS